MRQIQKHSGSIYQHSKSSKDVSEGLKVLMIGPGRNVMGGISTVVNSYFDLSLNKSITLHYIASMEDGNKIKKFWVAIKAYFEFKECLNNFDIVHVHMAAQASFTRKSVFIRLAKKTGKKIIIHQHSADFDDYFFKQSDKKRRQKIKEIFAMADRVIALSEEWANFFGKYICDSKKIVVIHNAVVMPSYRKTDYADHNVLFLGRLGERKGTYDLIKAIPEILKEVPDVQFFLGGDGEIEKTQRIIYERKLSNHVKLLGWIRDNEKEEYLKKCSIFILPSYHEGMPMAVLEAMSYGLATVSTNAGGIPQIIKSGINGIRIEAGDIDAIKKVLVYLLQNTKRKKELGIAGRECVKECFNAENNIRKLLEVYVEVIK